MSLDLSPDCRQCMGTGRVSGKRCSCWDWYRVDGPDPETVIGPFGPAKLLTVQFWIDDEEAISVSGWVGSSADESEWVVELVGAHGLNKEQQQRAGDELVEMMRAVEQTA